METRDKTGKTDLIKASIEGNYTKVRELLE